MADDLAELQKIFRSQAEVCARFGSRFYAALCGRIASDLRELTPLFAPWDGLAFEDLMAAAVSLRFLGSLHDLALSGDDLAMAAAFPPMGDDADAAWTAALAAIERDTTRFIAFMEHEPQTNEVRRSACLLPGFLTIAAQTRLPLACLELGASAGLNQLWRRFAYDYGAAGLWGDPASPVVLPCEWSGPPAPWDAPLEVRETTACDRKPVDVRDPAERRRLKAYLWPDQTDRILRFDAAAEMAIAAGVSVETADAAAWTAARAAPREGLTTVIYHSIFWQYLAAETQDALTAAIEGHGASASATAPLAWLRMEPADGKTFPIELRLTIWPSREERRLAIVHAHGATVHWEA